MKTLKQRFEEMVMPEPMSGCWLWNGGISPQGYGMIGIKTNTSAPAHRISYQLHKGEIPHGLLVCHSCDNRACVNPDHLFLGTHRDNTLDMFKKGRQNRINILKGQAHGQSKLTDNDVIDILLLLKDGAKGKDIAEKYSISQTVISGISKGKRWKHIDLSRPIQEGQPRM